ncbi:hypothetical protein AB0K09_14675 [Streptomyces sp. NPDC049577]|uniref:hypothetical protein n=1 Tax=Streptomyces sp. NPDC049577 TaxID=3155153 RepID=UPI003430C0E7
MTPTTRSPHRPGHSLARFSFAAAPAFLAGYGALRLLGHGDGPGVVWTVGHVLLLSGLALFVPVVRELHRGAGRVAGVAAAVAWAGLVAGIGQAAVDLVVGLRSADRTAMDALFGAVKSYPGVTPALYTVGPLLFYAGLLALTVTLALRRSAGSGGWSPVWVLAGAGLTAAGLALLPVAAVCYWRALAPYVPRAPRGLLAGGGPAVL